MTKRTVDQNALLHCWCREIALKLVEGGVNISEAMTKEVMKMTVGNTTEVLSVRIAMPTSKYKRTDEDLTQEQLDGGVLSMEAFLSEIQVWAATEINLELVSPNE